MTAAWQQRLPAVPRAIAVGVSDALTAARSEDAVAFQRCCERLAVLDREQVGLVLGAVVRSLLEEMHPGGLTGEDIEAVLAECAATTAWCPALDLDVLLVLIAGALGIHPDAEDPRPVSAAEMSCNAPLLIATLVGRSAALSFDAHLEAAFTEIARAETVEMP
jgi:hypothetical protein